jgi:hypothetical protein
MYFFPVWTSTRQPIFIKPKRWYKSRSLYRLLLSIHIHLYFVFTNSLSHGYHHIYNVNQEIKIYRLVVYQRRSLICSLTIYKKVHSHGSTYTHARADRSCPFYGQKKKLVLGNSNLLQALAECFHQITNLSFSHTKLADWRFSRELLLCKEWEGWNATPRIFNICMNNVLF